MEAFNSVDIAITHKTRAKQAQVATPRHAHDYIIIDSVYLCSLYVVSRAI